MKIYMMTDLEGPAGVLNRNDWVHLGSPYYEKAKILLTEEVNAAAEGFFRAGATEILVSDGHGTGGIQPELLDKRLLLLRGFPTGYPCGLTAEYNCVVWIGQHAKAGTPFAHIPHTGNHHVIDLSINGISIGELGELAMCAGVLGVKPILATGDKAMCIEAQQLLPGIETVSVKEGLMPGKGDECTYEEYNSRNIAAIHLAPQRARELIEEGAYRALKRFAQNPDSFNELITKAPYEKIAIYRPGDGKSGRTFKTSGHATPWDAINTR
ncbi:MAG: M55 family metallopeptidase [Clostridiales bacterium]|nr:M55 family metallopeptidase [Clostridiales bacterium]